MKPNYKKMPSARAAGFKFLLLLILLCGGNKFTSAQCPTNLDFEEGDFNGWECWLGTTYLDPFSGKNIIDLSLVPGPVAGRHTMLNAFPGNGNDQYGLFPQNCPNGSGHSIKLGNNTVTTPTTRAQGVSYTFTIPPGQNEYNLIYHYAVILHLPAHPDEQKPRFVVVVENLTDNTILPCPLDPFIPGNSLPGFFDSPVNPDVKCKNWAAASINLDGLAGKTIRVFFKTATCTPAGHFGYAYIDVNTECTSSFTGAVFCPDDAFINVTAPYGYQDYTWYNSTFTAVLGNTQTINFTPPPPPGTQIAVVVDPFNGYGCRDTLYANLIDTLTIQSQAGPDKVSCNGAPVQLGAIPTPNYVYSWTPAAGLSNPNISNPIATPAVTTQYILTTTNAGGGCASRDTVNVAVSTINNTLTLIGPDAFCPDGTQSAILQVLAHDSIQWYRNNIAIPGATQTQYNVTQSGTYHATLFTFTGCSLSTVSRTITVHPMPDAAFTVNTTDQCLLNNQYVFTNASTISSGSMQFDWDFGDGNLANTANATHSYTLPGTYIVKMLVTSNNGCKDSSFYTVNVFTMPVADFTVVSPAVQCFKDHQFVFTNTSSIASGTLTYDWNMGDGTIYTSTNVTHTYTTPGNYSVRLIVTSDKGCVAMKHFTVYLNPSPLSSFSVDVAEQCFKDNRFVFTNNSSVLSGNLFYTWDMGDANTYSTKDVTHSYTQPGTYTVKLLTVTNNGCRDSSFFNVTVNPQPLAAFSINAAEQCFTNNLFVFTNTSNILWGNMQYAWDLGNGTTGSTLNATQSYLPGDYIVKLVATSDKGCIDDSSYPVRTYPLANADFDIAKQPVCTFMNVDIVNKTINNIYNNIVYVWDFGNGDIGSGRNPVYSYPAPANYTVRLSVHLPLCPLDITTDQINISVEAPVPGIRYPDKTAIFNFPEQLQARSVGTSVLWKPATSLDNRISYSPVFKGINSTLYTIELKTPVGCVTVDTQFVKALRKVEIYVPTSFTPDNNGKNDYLRPMLYGFDRVNYFRIFDRWGKLLYEMKSDRPGWDGKIGGKAQEMQTLVWMIEAVDVDGVVHRKQGTTVLLR